MAKTAPAKALPELEEKFFSQVPDAQRNAALTWAQCLGPKPWGSSWVRHITVEKMDVARWTHPGVWSPCTSSWTGRRSAA